MKIDTDVRKILFSAAWIGFSIGVFSWSINRLTLGGKSFSQSSPQQAKDKKQFWVATIPGEAGYPLDGLSDPRLFRMIFPGYPDQMRLDTELWNTYFKEKFIQSVPYAGLSKDSFGTRLMLADYRGCLPIIQKYGVDILFLGNSEIFSVAAPDLFADLFAKWHRQSHLSTFQNVGKPPRILVCGGDLSFPGLVAAIRELATSMRASGNSKTMFTVLEYSTNFPVQERVAAHPNSSSKRNWDKLLKLNFDRWSNLFDIHWPWDRWSIPKELAENPVELEKQAATLETQCGHFVGATEDLCTLDSARASLQALLTEVTRFSNQVILYYPATTPLHHNAGPKCLDPSVRNMLKDMASAQVSPLVQDWRDFGLQYSNYLFKTKDPEFFTLDENHPSWTGARILTQAIVNEMIRQTVNPSVKPKVNARENQ